MSKEIREELRGWIRSATPGRWKALMGGGSIWVNLSTYVHREYKVADNIAPEDAKLIAATHNALPGLLDELDEKDAEIERLKATTATTEIHRDHWRNKAIARNEELSGMIVRKIELLTKCQQLEARITTAERERDLYKAMYLKTAEGKCDADARVGALERALNFPGCSNPECHWYTPCDTCRIDSDFCDHLCDDEGEAELDMSEACPFWQFDQASFEA